MTLATLLLVIFSCLLSLVGCSFAIFTHFTLKSHLKKSLDFLNSIDDRTYVNNHLASSIDSKVDSLLPDEGIKSVQSKWIEPKREKPRVVRRSEADEYDMEQPLGERKV
jgi:hypothetical protein